MRSGDATLDIRIEYRVLAAAVGAELRRAARRRRARSSRCARSSRRTPARTGSASRCGCRPRSPSSSRCCPSSPRSGSVAGRRRPASSGFRPPPAGAEALYADYARRVAGAAAPARGSRRRRARRRRRETEKKRAITQEVWDEQSSRAKVAFRTPADGSPAFGRGAPAPQAAYKDLDELEDRAAPAMQPAGDDEPCPPRRRRRRRASTTATCGWRRRRRRYAAGWSRRMRRRAPGRSTCSSAPRRSRSRCSRCRPAASPRGRRRTTTRSPPTARSTCAPTAAWHALAITAKPARVELRHVAVPREQPDVFRVAAIANPLAGAAVARADRRLRSRARSSSRATSTTRRPARSVEVGLGVDPTVKIARNTEFREEATGMLRGGLRLVHAIAIDIENLSARPDRSRGARARAGRARRRRRRRGRDRQASSRRGSGGRRIPTRPPTSGCAAAIAGACRCPRAARCSCAPVTRSRSRASTSSSAATGGSRERAQRGCSGSSAMRPAGHRARGSRVGHAARDARGARRPAAHRRRARVAGARRQDADRSATGARVLDVALRALRRAVAADGAGTERDELAARLRAERMRSRRGSRTPRRARVPRATRAPRSRRRSPPALRDLAVAASRGVAAGDAAAARRARRARSPRRARVASTAELEAAAARRRARAGSTRGSRGREADAGDEAARLMIDVVADAGGDAVVTCSYVVPGAAWRPYHRATLLARRPARRVADRRRACGRRPARTGATSSSRSRSSARRSASSRRSSHDDELRTRRRPDDGHRRGARSGACRRPGSARRRSRCPASTTAGSASSLRGAQRMTIAPTARRTACRSAASSAPAQLSLVAIPLRSPWVHLRARIVNTGAVPLLAGPVDLIMASGYVGRAEVGFVAAGREVRSRLRPRGRPARASHRGPRARRRRPARRLERADRARRGAAVEPRRAAGARSSSPSASRSPRSSRSTSSIVGRGRVPAARARRGDHAGHARALDERGLVSWTVELPPLGRRAVTLEYKIRSQRDVAGV